MHEWHPTLSQLQDDDLLSLLRIRQFELALLELFSQGKLHGTTHTSLGQEYIPVALNPLFEENDFLFSNHRGHGHYLARYADLTGLLAEIMGREGAICQGLGGSQHLYREQQYLSTGVQGEALPVACGVALHLKRAKQGAMAVVYIGDGTWGEGTTYEALNIARLWQLPLLVIVENNQIAQSTPRHQQMAGTIEGRTRAFDVNFLRVVSDDINLIRSAIAPHIQSLRTTCLPLVIEFETYRLGPHSKGDDTRDEATLQQLQQNDWQIRYQQQFPDQSLRCTEIARQQVEAVIADVEQRPLLQVASVVEGRP
ncbi:thiamine pyrophosphate-dependent dehydrogenase E1 component subunit alpha [Tengunoibacter tsumagoiensis]|uniref:Dehydrogenase n=1 Tax=Tengunoibacter tsumagoiensis TaxID=2014871 RepID=A0A402A9V2_9CHLR|nr:thiamine pyrophosphate-dependent dehydrogenase E1 component subunit alpha [Tengunoibacter tsumagoiensis]GCE15796.1 dehydrogenase [Tengunoibacter tsumagoiensis]